MKRKILTSFLIVLLTHNFMGCAVYSSAAESNAFELSEKDKVISVELHSNETVVFNDDLGKIIVNPECIKGRTVYGNKVSYGLTEVGKLFVANDTTPVSVEQLRADASIRISRLVLWYQTVDFNDDGGRYFPEHLLIKGKSVLGKDVEIGGWEIKNVRLENRSSASPIFQWSGVGLIAVILIFLLIPR